MRIILHSNAPHAATGYGQQVNIFAPRLRDLGHEILVSAFYGIQGAPMNWDGIKVLPGSTVGDAYGTGILLEHFRHERADLVLTLMDVWVLEPSLLAQMPVAHWLPVDCDPLSVLDGISLAQSNATPIAMSRFGESRLRERGFSPQFVPHGLHPSYCGELPQREDARKVFQVGDNFVIGMNAANKDAFRKGMAEQMYAFARLNRKYPDTLLLIHGMVMEQGALDLNALAQALEISHAVRYVDQYAYLTGQIPVEHLVTWYRALDLYSGASLGEGFGIPLIEAQACFPAETHVSASNVLRTMERKYTGELITIKTARGDTVRATSEHPFWTRRGWVPAGQLRSDDHLLYTGNHASPGILQVHTGRIDDVVATVRANDHARGSEAHGKELQRSAVASQAVGTAEDVRPAFRASSSVGYSGAVGVSGGTRGWRGYGLDPEDGREKVEAGGQGHQYFLAAHGVATGGLRGSVYIHGASSSHREAGALLRVSHLRTLPPTGVRNASAAARHQTATNGLPHQLYQGAATPEQGGSADGEPVGLHRHGPGAQYQAIRPTQYQAICSLERSWVTDLPVYNLKTASSTYVAEGYLVHNCEIPVVVTDASAMTENAGSGWIVPGEPFWNPTHKAMWCKPDTGAIYRAYETAYQRGKVYEAKKAKTRNFAMGFEPDLVTNEYWKPTLQSLAEGTGRKGPALPHVPPPLPVGQGAA